MKRNSVAHIANGDTQTQRHNRILLKFVKPYCIQKYTAQVV